MDHKGLSFIPVLLVTHTLILILVSYFFKKEGQEVSFATSTPNASSIPVVLCQARLVYCSPCIFSQCQYARQKQKQRGRETNREEHRKDLGIVRERNAKVGKEVKTKREGEIQTLERPGTASVNFPEAYRTSHFKM